MQTRLAGVRCAQYREAITTTLHFSGQGLCQACAQDITPHCHICEAPGTRDMAVGSFR